ncbi:MAG: glyoxalase/bleomycin resistance protein/dioxygenase [Bacteroidetes bacterium]|jgi:catechol 2,3-dioxygenase-like lactoylglutathione lyase family enzyme|nr:MAG: glyoxalase/bleomycin resistance protein/dioxygenase [Bacteroidota bacterium]
MAKKVNGIQQLGVGVTDIQEAFAWYRRYFGMDIKMFEEAAMAELMLPHTQGEPRERHAILALNLQGGGGFEIWQHTGKKPEKPGFELQLGDLGIFIGKLKSADIEKTYDQYKKWNLNLLSGIMKDPAGNKHFYLSDLYGNIWEIVYDSFVFKKQKSVNGGIFGAVVGVKNIDESIGIYSKILGYDVVVYDETSVFADLKGIPGSENKLRRVLLRHSEVRNGAFSPMFGPTCIELVQVIDRTPRDIYEGRLWGDPGFIHLCFDIDGMDDLREEVKEEGFPFTVDSAREMDTFDMGEAAGSFSYIQAPEGTLIEFVETHKIPLVKKLGWSLDLTKRKAGPLPKWMFSLFAVMRVK